MMDTGVLRCESGLVVCSLDDLNGHTLTCLGENVRRLRLELISWNCFFNRGWLLILVGFLSLHIRFKLSWFLWYLYRLGCC